MKFSTLLKLIAYSFIFLAISCSDQSDLYHLTQRDAEIRSELVENVSYKLNISLTKQETFTGKVEIRFLAKEKENLRVDYFSGRLTNVILNSKTVTDSILKKGGFFFLPAEGIVLGENIVSIEFETPYSRTGNGLHKFVDPDDKETYIYSQFEAFHANKMFPCFDQPDLKAKFTLSVNAPKTWKVISTTLASSIAPNPSDLENSLHVFPETSKISTYVFSLHAGSYQVWEDKYNTIPLRLFVRKSLAKHVDPKDWFLFTKQGFEFFDGYFGIVYPFLKYDQIIVPEFNFGAMENVGAVTFSERFVSRSAMTRAQRENLSDVILHEMAHMWFGNLVTMKWWNGLWLNESFATYMASLAQEKNSEFVETWESFFEKMKQWAYDEDSFVTNHPVEAKVNNTEEAFTQFDGITYGKGASVLKQLVFFIGETSFQKGVQSYLKKYSYSNATLGGFLSELEFASGFPLKKWSKDWLETKGTNEIEFLTICEGNHLGWKLIQSAPGNANKLRDHKINIGLYFLEEKELKYKSIPVLYRGRSISGITSVSSCPNFVLVNGEDHDFVVWIWNEVNLEELKLVLSQDKDSFRKLILWTSFYNQITSGKAKFDSFLELAKVVLPKEENLKIKKWVLSKLSSDRGFTYFTSQFWYPEDLRNKQLTKLEDFFWEGLNRATIGSDEQKYWFFAYLESSYTKTSIDKIWEIYNGRFIVPGLKIDQDIKWSLLTKLASLNYQKELITVALEKEKKADPSLRGVNSSLAIEASFPDKETKTKWMDLLRNPKKSGLSSSSLRTVAYHLFPVNQKDLQFLYLDDYLDALENFTPGEDENYLDGFAKSLAPNFCADETKLILKKFVSNHPRLPVSIQKTLLKQIDLETKCLAMKKKHFQ
ncbi:aminopeptidase N [Leptospira ilyithenensis]|uniref:Aminopeptidase N n=1 Tax=Leptospira ilyithenensis TaxID=2484901 RepID=A0A4R9LPI5_9LEPT|nr:aminopeptidase N [Leptospira ilyithenensis]TGN10921.1 aminopeptidase N [Leptospira ilyithenensis]